MTLGLCSTHFSFKSFHKQAGWRLKFKSYNILSLISLCQSVKQSEFTIAESTEIMPAEKGPLKAKSHVFLVLMIHVLDERNNTFWLAATIEAMQRNDSTWVLSNTLETKFTQGLVAVGKRWYSLAFPRLSGSVTIWRDCLSVKQLEETITESPEIMPAEKEPLQAKSHVWSLWFMSWTKETTHFGLLQQLTPCNRMILCGCSANFRKTIHTGFGGWWNALIFFWLLPFSPFLSASILKKLLPNQLKSCRRHSATQRQQPAKRHIHVFDRRNSRGSLQESNQPDWLLLREGWANCKNPFTKFLADVGKRWYSLAFPPLSVSVTIWRDDSRINSNHVGGTLTSKKTCFSSSVMGRTVLHSETNHLIKSHLVSARHTLASNPFTNKLADGWSSKAITSSRLSAFVSQWNTPKKQSHNQQKSCRQKKILYRQNHMFGPCDSCLGRKKQHILACCNNWRHATEWFYVGAQQYFRNTIHTGFGGGWNALIFFWLLPFSPFLSASILKKLLPNQLKSCRRHSATQRQQPAKTHIHVFDRRNSRGSLQEPNQPDWLLLREGWANCKNPFTKFLAAAVGKRWYSLAFPRLSVSVTIWRDDSRINSNHVGGTLTSKKTCFSSSVMGRTNQYIPALHSKTNHPIKWHLVSARHTLASFTNKLADGWRSKAMTSFRFSASVSQWNNLKRW